MIDNKKNELRDYLFTVLQKMDLDEEEVKVMSEYAHEIIELFVPMLNITASEQGKDKFTSALSKLIEEKYVKRDA